MSRTRYGNTTAPTRLLVRASIALALVLFLAFYFLIDSDQPEETTAPTASNRSGLETEASRHNAERISAASAGRAEPPVQRLNQTPPPVAASSPPNSPSPVDFEKVLSTEDLSPELIALIQTAYVEFTRGNIDHAALIALDAMELSENKPRVRLTLHYMIGYSYENLGYIDMAREQYQMALAIYPKHRPSYASMRRLDPEFSAAHPALPPLKPKKK